MSYIGLPEGYIFQVCTHQHKDLTWIRCNTEERLRQYITSPIIIAHGFDFEVRIVHQGSYLDIVMGDVLGVGRYAKEGDICIFHEGMFIEGDDGIPVQVGHVFLSMKDTLPKIDEHWLGVELPFENYAGREWFDDEKGFDDEERWIEQNEKELDGKIEVVSIPLHIVTHLESGTCVGLMSHLFPEALLP
jgi:hypothetical protein